MAWYYYALLCAFCLATTDALCKQALQDSDEVIVAWVRLGFALPFLFLASFHTAIPHLDRTFWYAVVMLLPLELTAIVLYMRAIKISPLSLCVPFLALTPVFLIFIAYLLLGELPDTSGILGIVCIAAGAYLLNFHQVGKGILAPLRSILRERGSMMMIVVAFIFSLTSTLGKRATLLSSPLFFGTFYTLLLTVALSPLALVRLRQSPVNVHSHLKTFLLIGFFYALMVYFHYQALAMVEVSYMISIKRTSLLFSILFGRIFFGESNVGERLVGGLIMLVGVVLITVV